MFYAARLIPQREMLRFTLALVLPSVITAAVASTNTGNENQHFGISKSAAGTESSQSIIASTAIQHCFARELNQMVDCFVAKTIGIVDKASRMKNIEIIPGVNFVIETGDGDSLRNGRAMMNDEEIEKIISTDSNDKSAKLVDMLIESMSRFIDSHTLRLSLPKSTTRAMQRAAEEGRAKLKKKLLPFLGLLGIKIFALLPWLLGTLGFLALKALVVGKIALIVAGVLALQKYTAGGTFGSGFGNKHNGDGWGASGGGYSPAINGGGGYYKRSMEDHEDAQQLAYNAQTPTNL